MDKGFVILAENTKTVDYVSCAETLAHSIKKIMPDEKITLISTSLSNSPYFDSIVTLPHGDLSPDSEWKLINDWQVYDASPYEYTIKLEADMYIPIDISYWWDVLVERELVISTHIRDFRNQLSTVKTYRRFITDNKLPDTYNAITYFKKSELAKRFFMIVRDVFEHWEEYKALMKSDPKEIATTDWVYAIAAHIVGTENCTLPDFKQMSMIHMKRFVNSLVTEDWTKELVIETHDVLKINTIPQRYPFHYHVKSFHENLRIGHD
jgi:hypothetical protein